MAGIKKYVQDDLRAAPTEQTHVVRLKDMIEYVAGMTKSAVRVVLNAPFAGTYNSVALTLTQTTPLALTVDDIVLAANDRVLLTGQLDKTQNGIYILTTVGVDGTTSAVLTRSADLNQSTDVINGMIVPVTDGTSNAGTRWKCTVGALPFVLDATTMEFAKEITDFTKVVEMTFAIVGDTTTTDYDFSHNLDTLNVTHELYEDVSGETVVAGFKRLTSNDVRVSFSEPLGAGSDFTLVIRAEVDPV